MQVYVIYICMQIVFALSFGIVCNMHLYMLCSTKLVKHSDCFSSS